ncbi:MAG: hypothetical protein H8D23_38355 [Candidatus Brocadiales bacterium]|nr:hypothetical protein [Candidatus Brocadiales bacterium]
MSKVNADIESLIALRKKQIVFAGQQKDSMDIAEMEVLETIREIETVEMRICNEIGYAEQEYEEYLQNDSDVDGRSASQDSLFEIEQKLSTLHEKLKVIQEYKNQVQIASDCYRASATMLSNFFSDRLAQANRFLDNRISSLEAYYSTQLLDGMNKLSKSRNSNIRIMATNIASYISNGPAAKSLGNNGEQIAAHILSERYGLEEVSFDQPLHGIDRIFKAPGIPLIIVESKTRRDGILHLRSTKHGKQMSPEWIADKAEKMSNRESAQWSPANEKIAQAIKSLRSENIPAITVVTKPDEELIDIYFRQNDNSWEILEENIPWIEISEEV